MTITLYDMSVPSFRTMLTSLSELLDHAAERARDTGGDPDAFAEMRLASDMYPLQKQVQIACQQARDAVDQLKGAPPAEPRNDERCLGDLKELIGRTIAVLDGAAPGDFAGADARTITIPLPTDGMRFEMNGLEYLRDWALPHFYFHVVTAYDILRHHGVQIGKRDYMSQMVRYIRQ